MELRGGIEGEGGQETRLRGGKGPDHLLEAMVRILIFSHNEMERPWKSLTRHY